MRAVLMSSVTGAMMFAAAVAQAAPTTIQQEVKVPFAFVVNGHELPAGTYAVRQDNDQAGALLIQGEHGSAYVLTTPVAASSASQGTSMVFAKDGDRYRLAEVWDGDGDGVAVVESK